MRYALTTASAEHWPQVVDTVTGNTLAEFYPSDIDEDLILWTVAKMNEYDRIKSREVVT